MVQSVATRRWTVEELYRILEAGVFDPDERIELIEGEVVPVVTQGRRHSMCVSFATNLLVEAYGKSHLVRVQLPLQLGDYSEPEPDFALVRKDEILKARRHDIPAYLVIEVAQTSLRYDRREKASLYAKMGVKEYWILNVVDRVLERHLEPEADEAAPYGFSYRDRTVLSELESVKARYLEGPELAVAELLGPELAEE